MTGLKKRIADSWGVLRGRLEVSAAPVQVGGDVRPPVVIDWVPTNIRMSPFPAVVMRTLAWNRLDDISHARALGHPWCDIAVALHLEKSKAGSLSKAVNRVRKEKGYDGFI
ncbi:hypothetical protein BBC27_05795 [Acidithiobacillus ferrivorans]|uniref:Uncharacterized protein n=2 Tax=Acidithiobacillus ferrivorans TaxID=160808 RepID=A0A1B9C1Q8_9PROT|nr:hypothetical protein BBC27_05795 [Acidithiobacillus ferrivorans]